MPDRLGLRKQCNGVAMGGWVQARRRPVFSNFNPETQRAKFDPDGVYQERWIAEIANNPTKTATSYFDAIPKGWKLKPDLVYPAPVVTLSEGRQRALNAYENRCF